MIMGQPRTFIHLKINFLWWLPTVWVLAIRHWQIEPLGGSLVLPQNIDCCFLQRNCTRTFCHDGDFSSKLIVTRVWLSQDSWWKPFWKCGNMTHSPAGHRVQEICPYCRGWKGKPQGSIGRLLSGSPWNVMLQTIACRGKTEKIPRVLQNVKWTTKVYAKML